MKKLISCVIISIILSSLSCMSAYAAHQHSDSCYTIEGAHSHSGDSVNGGGCYNVPVYHSHSGSAESTFSNGCYTKAIIKSEICNVTVNNIGGTGQTQRYCTYCRVNTTCSHTGIEISHSSCGQATLTDWNTWGEYRCITCGTLTESYGTRPNSTSHNYDVTYYDLGCGKTEDTVESWEMGCGLEESAGTKVLTCTTPESVDTPAPAPAPTPTPSEPVVTTPSTPAETKPAETKEEITADDFDFRVQCNLVEDGAEIKIIPNNKDILADNPYSWDNGISWNDSDTSIFAKDGTYYIAIQNKEGKIKYKKLEINLQSTNFAVVTDYAATLTDKEYKDIIQEEEEPVQEEEVVVEAEPVKKGNAGKVIGIIAIILGCLALMGGIGYFIFMLLFKSNAKIVDREAAKVVAKINLKKKGGKVAVFEANISDKVLLSLEGGFAIQPASSIVNKYVGYTLMVKSSQGIVETEIAESIDVDF